MKRTLFLLTCIVFLIFSCATDESQTVEEEILPVQAAEEPEIIEVEPILEEETPVPEETVYDEEYLRSVGNLSGEGVAVIPYEVFEEDKNQIFVIINDLDRIMKKKDFNSWFNYLTPESQEYWSNKHNLQQLSLYISASGGFKINNIREYFETFFIPSRRGRIVDEIRYVTPDYVKVVQYTEQTDIIYYFFEKCDGEWKLWLDTLN